MTKEQAIEVLHELDGSLYETQQVALDMAIKALEQDNKEIFKKFKKKAFLESEDILGIDMVDSYMITDYLAELMGVEND